MMNNWRLLFWLRLVLHGMMDDEWRLLRSGGNCTLNRWIKLDGSVRHFRRIFLWLVLWLFVQLLKHFKYLAAGRVVSFLIFLEINP